MIHTNNKIIVRVDGGICSQIAFHAYGLYLSQIGYDVEYDLSWFKTHGVDLNWEFVRNYDFPKAFPKLAGKKASKRNIRLYKKNYNQTGKALKDITAPAYIGGYPSERGCLFIKNQDLFKTEFLPLDRETIQKTLQDIEACNSCAVHVRRGDLSHYDPAYGCPTSVEYFLNAINTIKSIEKDSVFFFFSDEPNWVRNNIIPYVDSKIKCHVLDQNGSDKGYLDLFLISKCKNIIASQGSMGKFGKLLSWQNPHLVLPNASGDIKNIDNIIVLQGNNTIVEKKENISLAVQNKFKKYMCRFLSHITYGKVRRKYRCKHNKYKDVK